jgi:hypothetical protein
MIFGRLEERVEQAAPPLRQAAAAGRGDGNGGARSSDATSRVETSARLPEQGTPDRQARPVFPESDAR